jgi:hypothetical protein
MKGHDVAALGRSLPFRGFAGGGDLVIAVAHLVADHGPGASLARQAVAHSITRGFAFDREVKLPAAAGGMACHCLALRYSGSSYGSGARAHVQNEHRRRDADRVYATSLGRVGSPLSPRRNYSLAGARQQPSHDLLERIAPKFHIRIATTVMEFVLLYRFLGERRNLFFGLSLVFRKSPPFANYFSARIVVCFHVCGSLVRPALTYSCAADWPILHGWPRDGCHSERPISRLAEGLYAVAPRRSESAYAAFFPYAISFSIGN